MSQTVDRGFTLIELMIVVAIIGVLAAIAVPRFSKLMAKSQEGTTKGNLGTIRGALSIYYSENEGNWPADNLDSFLVGSRFLTEIPAALLPNHVGSTGHPGENSVVVTGHIPDTNTDGAGNAGWLYDNTGGGSDTSGQVIVNCTHNDIVGDPWTSR